MRKWLLALPIIVIGSLVGDLILPHTAFSQASWLYMWGYTIGAVAQTLLNGK